MKKNATVTLTFTADEMRTLDAALNDYIHKIGKEVIGCDIKGYKSGADYWQGVADKAIELSKKISII